MKKLVSTLALLLLLGASAQVSAHGDGHGVISDQEAVLAAATTVKKMTFKDFGFEAGKLGDQWKSVTHENVTLIDIIDGNFLLEVKHPETSETIYIQITKSGQAIAATEANPS